MTYHERLRVHKLKMCAAKRNLDDSVMSGEDWQSILGWIFPIGYMEVTGDTVEISSTQVDTLHDGLSSWVEHTAVEARL